MKADLNPLTQNNTSDTLAHIRDIMALLQEFFSSSEHPSTDYDKSLYLGIYCVLDVVRHALIFELGRVE
jgi:hypothetical protein